MSMRRILPVLVRVALGGIFLYAGVLKIMDPVGFAGSIAAYKLVPYFFSYLTAAILPWVEVCAGLLLICGFKVRAGALTIALLNLVFIAALASAIARGLDIDCGCFKAQGSATPPWVALLRDLVFLGMTGLVLWDVRERKDRAPAADQRRSEK